ncbi:hypothetical protein DFS34DRAFT_600255 [Phlyctochytrium arcticum]|nr:hypothetical protein DFS34DRAFT_600255 [Phlyctochytrium arcticum]
MALADLHVFSQISTQEYKGAAMQVLDLNTKTWQPMYAVDTAAIQQFQANESEYGRSSTFITFGVPAILGTLVLICFAWCVYRTRGCAEVTPVNINAATSSGLGPTPNPECLPTYGPNDNDIEMGDLARAIRESEIEAAANQTSLSPDIPAHAPPSYDDVVSSVATLPDNESARPSTDSTPQSDSPHNAVIVHDNLPSSIPDAAPITPSPS